MSKPAAVNLSEAPASLGVLAVRGVDAARFLQGQLSADIEKLDVGGSTLAGLHNPQGRVIALLAIVRTGPEEFFAVVPAELVTPVLQRLRKYVLRAKLTLDDASTALQVFGSATALPGFPAIAWGSRRLLLAPEARRDDFDATATAAADWLRADVAEGLPQVYAATSESFVAQMLNLDALGAIAFDKGCYTGQEIIARAHYRGRVKRRLQRWSTDSSTLLRPGDAARSVDGRSLTIVRVAASANGQDLLAVGALAASEEIADAPSQDAGAQTVVQVQGPLPLPYRLPE
jgi:folate-binding protein YgfZ